MALYGYGSLEIPFLKAENCRLSYHTVNGYNLHQPLRCNEGQSIPAIFLVRMEEKNILVTW